VSFAEPAGQAGRMDNYNLRADRALNPFDVPHRFVATYTVELPWYRRRTDLAGRVLGGWEVTGIFTLQCGTPLFLTAPNTPTMYADANRPNNNGASAKIEGNPQGRLARWFNTSVFSAPAAFTFGNTSRTLPDARNHGINSWDAGFFKSNRFGAEAVSTCNSARSSSTS